MSSNPQSTALEATTLTITPSMRFVVVDVLKLTIEHISMQLTDWRHIFFSSFISESPWWLLSRGRTKEVIVILEKMAQFNGNRVQMSPYDIVIKDFHVTTFNQFVKEMIKYRKIMYRLLVVSFNWYVNNICWYCHNSYNMLHQWTLC